MFSGIVETIGIIKNIFCKPDCKVLTIAPKERFDDLHIGDSVAINGVCLTVTSFTEHTFTVEVVPETLRLTNIDLLQTENAVNLERALKINGRLGGHCVQGHVDGVGKILEITHDGVEAIIVKIDLPKNLDRYIVNKGYITLDGMSITVINATPEWFTVTFIPHTQHSTIVKQYQVNTVINIEVDIFGKYIEKLIGVKSACQPA